jgi:hypothetical protein
MMLIIIMPLVYFLVTASIGTVGEGCRVCAFSELLWFVEGCPGNGFIAIFGHAAVGIVSVGSNYAVSYQYDINGNILNKSDVGDYSYNNVNSTHPHTPNSIAVTTSCLYFLVTASIGTVGEGCRVCAFNELLWFVEGCPGNGFIAIFGHAAVGIDDVDYNYAVSYQYDINGNILNKSDVGDYSYNNVNSTHPHTPNSIAGSGS